MNKLPQIIAVDFDGTLFFDGSNMMNYPLVNKLFLAKAKGSKLILWSCRGDEWLEDAIDMCKEVGLEFDAVNENIKGFNYTKFSCKVIADIYVDDKAPGSIKAFMEMDI